MINTKDLAFGIYSENNREFVTLLRQSKTTLQDLLINKKRQVLLTLMKLL